MKYLLDTNVLVWFVSGDERLSQSVVRLMERDVEHCRLSRVSVWEILIKQRLGKLATPGSILDIVEAMGMRLLGLDDAHLQALAALPRAVLTDVFDELLVAQAMAEGLTLITSDQKILKAPIMGLAIIDSQAAV